MTMSKGIRYDQLPGYRGRRSMALKASANDMEGDVNQDEVSTDESVQNKNSQASFEAIELDEGVRDPENPNKPTRYAWFVLFLLFLVRVGYQQ